MAFNPDICDLCHSPEWTCAAAPEWPRSMRSDGAIVATPLRKRRCTRCGLVRGGYPVEAATLDALYGGEYVSSEQEAEHVFYSEAGPVSRSSVFCDWISEAVAACGWQRIQRCLEVGAGAGHLLAEFSRRMPEKQFAGIEPSRRAVARARQRGLVVECGTPAECDGKRFDLIYAAAVFEHVPSPSEFLLELRRLVSPGGLVVLVQPTQEVRSYDLFFTDHLHHFATRHMRAYAAKTGFRELWCEIGHRWMPNFGLHVWRAVDKPDATGWSGPPARSACAESLASVLADMLQLNSLLERLQHSRRCVAAFGLGEVFSLARAYSRLGEFPLAGGMDDAWHRPTHRRWGFPAFSPDDCAAHGIEDVLLTMNCIHYPRAEQRLERFGVNVHRVLTAETGSTQTRGRNAA